ncbi:hypothetical protein E2320_006247, partial [Naja naja]
PFLHAPSPLAGGGKRPPAGSLLALAGTGRRWVARAGGRLLIGESEKGGRLKAGKDEVVAKSLLCFLSFTMADGEDVHGLKGVLVMFQSCLNGKEEILMDPYLGGWKGLVRFLNTMGPIFSFISKDAVTKIQIMENFRSNEQQENYITLQAMPTVTANSFPG